jgi:hypothetical protein
MTFLAPGALLGLVLLAIPIVIHLFKPRRVRQTPFSSLRWLHLTQQRMARRIQWHQVLLFLLRAAFLTLLILALARPLLVPRGGAGRLDRILVIDVSRSMGRRPEGRPRPIETARDLAAQMLQRMQPADRTAVLLAGAQIRVLAPWTTDAAPYLAALHSADALPTATNLDAALETLRSLLARRRPEAAVEICFFTDNTSGSWTPGAISSFVAELPHKTGISLRLVDVGHPGARNGWLASGRLRESDAGPMLHVEAACAGEAPQARTLRVAGLSGVKELSKDVTLQPGRPAKIDLPLPASFDRASSRARLRLDPPDELPDDDDFFVDLDMAGAAQVLLIELGADSDARRPGFPLQSALQALAEAGFPSADYQLSVRSPAEATAADFAAADVVLLADVPGLTASQAEALTKRIREGAGATIFLGPGVQPEIYNRRFTDRLHPAEGLLPAPLGSVVQVPSARGGLAGWGHWNEQHPLVAGLLDPLLGDLALTQSRAYLQFTEPAPAADEVLAAFEDGTPAVIARRLGTGRVVWFNASAGDSWCDLSRRKSFVPLVDRLLSYLSASGWRRSFSCGETVTLQLPRSQAGDDFVVNTPSGKTLQPHLESAPTGTLLNLEGLTEAGFYKVTLKKRKAAGEPSPEVPSATGGHRSGRGGWGELTEDQPLTFVVQPDRSKSALQPLDPDTLRSWWSPVKLDLVKPSSFGTALAAADSRLMFEPTLLLLAALVFLAEMFLVHWLCPRIDPALAISSAHRRGFVAPLRTREGTP